MASRPLKSKVSRAPVIFSEKTTENTRQDAQLRKDRTLARSLASNGRTFVKNFGTTLENLLSNLVEKDLESRGIDQDCFFRDVFCRLDALVNSIHVDTLDVDHPSFLERLLNSFVGNVRKVHRAQKDPKTTILSRHVLLESHWTGT